MGAVLGGLVVALLLGALLSVLVPDSQLLLALILLGLGEAAAVGFTVRYLSECRGLRTQVTAFVLTAIGVHVLDHWSSQSADWRHWRPRRAPRRRARVRSWLG